MGANVGFNKTSCGFVGHSDGWQDLPKDFRLDWEFDKAEDGNVAVIGEISPTRSREFTIGIAFGDGLHGAVTVLEQSLSTPCAEHRVKFVDQGRRAFGRMKQVDGVGRPRNLISKQSKPAVPGTNPEELLAAVHAGCFSMALAAQLDSPGVKPESIHTSAALTLEQLDGKWTIAAIHLAVNARVLGVDRATFEKPAREAKRGVPGLRGLESKNHYGSDTGIRIKGSGLRIRIRISRPICRLSHAGSGLNQLLPGSHLPVGRKVGAWASRGDTPGALHQHSDTSANQFLANEGRTLKASGRG